MLASCQLELKAALIEIQKKDRLIEKLSHKIKHMLQSTRSARSAAREAKEYAKNVEDESKKAAKRMEVEVDKTEIKCAQIKSDCERVVGKVRTMEQVSACYIKISR